MAAAAGVVTVIVVALTTTGFIPAIPPKVTVAGLWKFVPVIVTDVPPPEGPEVGAKLVIVGVGKLYVNDRDPVAVTPQAVTTIGTEHGESAAAAGVVTVIVVALTTTTFVPAMPPKVTVAGL